MTEQPLSQAPAGAGERTGSSRGAHRAPPSRRPLLLAVLAAVVLALVAGAVVLVGTGRGGESSAEPASTPAAPAPRVTADVAGWVDAELPADIPLSVPEDLRAALAAAGTPEDRLVADGADALRLVEGDPGADAVVVARFRDDDGTLLSVVDPRPGRPTADELDQRRRLSAAVLANPIAGATGRAAEVLRGADVDARLLGLLAVLVAGLEVGIADLPPAPGQPEEGTPVRRVLLRSAGGEPLVPGSAAAERVRTFVAAQLPPFTPDTVDVTEEGVLVGFDYLPAPDAAVTAATR